MASFAAKSIFATVAILAFGRGDANAFLRPASPHDLAGLSADSVRSNFLSELVGTHAARVEQLEAQLRPMFLALPKGPQGLLEPSAVRYALHRYFVHRHGWYIKGLEPAGGSWNTSSPTSVTKDRVPAYIQGLFEERMGGGGFGLHELAVFAATLENLIHDEATARLEDVYRARQVQMVGDISPEEVREVLSVYMTVFILGGNLSSMTQAELSNQLQEMESVYPAWEETLAWTLDVQPNVAFAARDKMNPFRPPSTNFGAITNLVQEVGERFGAFQDLECRSLKAELLEREHGGTGRVRLAEFYRGGLGGQWQFTESAEYLRTLGALDETDPKRPSVIIPNYVGSQSNCLASSSLYSVCCLDECEALMGHLERRIASPSGSPRQIAELVAGLPSDTVEAPRNLSTSLLGRLQDIADRHAGRVPLHGRLFAQWMHHAYPRECPFPHEVGTTSPLTPDEWMSVAGQDAVVASDDEMRRHANDLSHQDSVYMSASGKAETLPWTDVEELVIPHSMVPHVPAGGSSFLSAARNMLLLAAFASAALHVVRSAKLETTLPLYKLDKHIV